MPQRDRPCPCGSGKQSWWAHDARGIPLARVCTTCKAAKLGRYRTEVLRNPDYHCDEQVEPDL